MKHLILSCIGCCVLFFLVPALPLTAQIRYADSVIAFSSQSSDDWSSADQILGVPNTYPLYGDERTAWACQTADDQREFIEVQFPDPAPACMIAIYETNVPGAVDTVYVKNPGTMQWEIVWSGTAAALPYPDSRIFVVKFPLTSFDVSEVRIAINSPAVIGWNEYDAVGISSTTELDLPDLRMGSVQTPTEAWSGQTIDVSWTVQNIGSAATSISEWFDKIYLMPTSVLDPISALLEESITNNNPLDPGESYLGTASIELPLGLEGNYYLFVYTDINHTMPESTKVNNLSSASPMLIHFSSVPDLAVSLLQVPRIVFAGDTIDVSYTVTNTGEIATPDGSEWTDAILIGEDSTLNLTDAYTLATIDYDSVLQIDSSYHRTVSVVIPNTIVGPYYLYVYTDRWDFIFENYLEGNNIRRSDSISVVGVPPDLTVTSITIPSSASSGDPITVDWTVQNIGAGVTYEANWSDAVYLSSQEDFDENESTLLGTHERNGALAPDSAYQSSLSLFLPNGISGQYYIFVQTDYHSDVFESDTRTNNLRRSTTAINISLSPWPDLQVTSIQPLPETQAGQPVSVSWTVKNAGTGSTSSSIWSDAIYVSTDSDLYGPDQIVAEISHTGALESMGTYTASSVITIPPTISDTAYVFVVTDVGDIVFEHTEEENNTGRSAAFIVQAYPPVDLAISSFSVPDSGFSGGEVNVQWTVSNLGSGRTVLTEWEDAIYLSADTILNTEEDLLVSPVQHEGALDPGKVYNRSVTLSIPADTFGIFYWFIVTETSGLENDVNRINNVGRSAEPVVIINPPRPDLQVTSVQAASSVIAGQPAMVHWTVENNSAGSVDADEWFDAVYLSDDSILDLVDTKLGTISRSDPDMEPASSYNDSVEVMLPASSAGSKYILVQTDSRNTITETNEENNVGSTGTALAVAAPSDLVVTNISMPDSAEPGELITIEYTLRNQGANPASGWLTDVVYVSSNTSWEVDDPVACINSHQINLAPGASVRTIARVRLIADINDDTTETTVGELPGILPGQYHLIVRTDVRKNIPESSETNNLYTSVSTIIVHVSTLIADNLFSGIIKQEQSKYFAFSAVSSEDLLVTLDGASSLASLELFIKYGSMPGRSAYDFLYPLLNSPKQEITIPSTQAGTYYLLVRGTNVPGDSIGFTLLIHPLQFGIDSVSSAVGGNQGEVTIRIFGAKFGTGARAQLRRTGYSAVDDNSNYLFNSTHINARFSTVGLEPGSYDVVVINPDFQEAILHNGLTIEAGDPIEVQVSIIGPSRILRNRLAPMYILATNPTNVNIQRTAIFLKVPRGLDLSVETDHCLFDTIGGIIAIDTISADAEGNRMIVLLIYNIHPGRSKIINMFVRPTEPSKKYKFDADVYVCDRATFDSLLVVTVRYGIEQGFLRPPSGGSSFDILTYRFYPMSTNEGCPYDDPGACSYWDMRNRSMDVAQDAQDVVLSGGEAAHVFRPGGLLKVGKFLKDLMDFFNNWKNSSGYAGDGVESVDPNDMIGPNGVGDDKWVAVSQTLPYTIRFENDPTKATAPAQSVRVDMNLDSTLDEKSFRLMSFGFAGLDFTAAEGQSYFSQRLDVRDSLGVYVDVAAGVDVANRRVFWYFQSVDPATGELPTDPMIGMLPVNDSLTHHGEGFLNYTIRPKNTSKTRDIIAPKAKIVFDINEPMETPSFFNTIDAGLPSSVVQALPTSMSNATFLVQWSGQDDSAGSGVGSYSVYVSSNGVSFQPWLTNVHDTSYSFIGTEGTTYKFFSVAIDIAGNAEPMKHVGEATTIITGVNGEEKQVPKEFSLSQNYPNPFNPTTTFRYELPVQSTVTLQIYNVLGQLVSTLVDGSEQAGYKTINWNASSVASGVYFYRLEATGMSNPSKYFTQVKKMILLK